MSNIKSILSKLPQGTKATIGFLFASVISKGIIYITTPLYTEFLTPAQYGKATLFFTWLQIFGIIAMFCLSYGVFNNGMVEYPTERDNYSFSMLILSNLITVVFCIVLVFVYPLIRSWIELEFPFLVLMIALFLVQPAYDFFVAKQRYEMKYKATVIWTLVISLLAPFVSLYLIVFTDFDRLYSRVFGTELILLLIYIGFYVYLGVKCNWKVEYKYWKKAFLFNLPLIPHYLSSYLLGSVDKIMISKLEGEDFTAFYGVAYSVASIATIVWNAINSSLIPFTYENCKKKNNKAISTVVSPILFLFAIVCVVVIMLAPEVVAILGTEEYISAIYVIPSVVAGVFFQIQYYIYANVIYYYKRPKYVMYASVVSVIVNVVLNYVLISAFGYLAAGYTTLVCYALQAAMDYCAMKKVVKEEIYNMKIIGVLSLFVVIIALLSNLIYDTIVIRYTILFAIGLSLFVFRNKIVKLYKKIKDVN